MTIQKTILLSLSIFCFSVSAAERPMDRRNGPPKEAVQACENHSENDEVTFTGRRGESIDAICIYIDELLVAVPKDRVEHHQ